MVLHDRKLPRRGGGNNLEYEGYLYPTDCEFVCRGPTRREELSFDIHHDEDVEIYLNESLACKLSKGPTIYVVRSLS